MPTYFYDDKHLGRVYIGVRRDARRLIARWKDGHVHVSVPAGTTADALKRFLTVNREAIERLNHTVVAYHCGQMIACYKCKATIAEQDRLPGRIIFGHEGDDVVLSVPRGIDYHSESATRSISSALQVVMGERAPALLLPHAGEVAARLGVQPAGWQVGRGLRKLGHCTTQGVIQLSRALMFLPEDLVDLTVCHELAHLTHFDHSPAFHRLLDSYLGGREAELEARLKNFKWPILR